MILRLAFFIVLVLGVMSCSTKKQSSAINHLPDGKYELSHGDLSIIIDPDLGSRVISAKLAGKEILLQEREGLMNWGATLWPAPQSRWNWPPPAAIHIGKYASKIQEDKLILEGEADTTFGFRARKTFSFDAKENCMVVEYQIFNVSDSAQSVGPWEITCVPTGGIVFFPLGTEPEKTSSNLFVENVNGIGVFKYEFEKLQPWQKIFNNAAEGWLAHVTDSDVLFIKSFEKVSAEKLAPGQGNVEVYVSKDNKYIELENHGNYAHLKPGDSLSYRVKWHFVQLSESNGNIEFGQKLLDLVQSTLN